MLCGVSVRMRARGPALVATLVALSVVAAPPAMATCWEPAEYEAARIRDLQTMLMVSALQCGRRMPEMPGAYNRFVGRAKERLVEGEKHLVAHFTREGDKLRYDRFTTALANRYAELAQDPAFCERAKAVLDADEATNGAVPTVVALLNAKPNGVGDICPGKPRASVIVVSPFAPLPEGAAATPQAAGPAPTTNAGPSAAPQR